MGLFSLYKPKEYKYRYIYYDPKKEALKEREKENEKNSIGENGEFKSKIRRGTFREMAHKKDNTRKLESQKSNIRLIMILVILLAVAYFMLK